MGKEIKSDKLVSKLSGWTDTPLFSICIVTYNQRHLLMDCLESVYIQDYPNIEIVVCDDESCDFDALEVHRFIEEGKGDNIKNVIVYKQEKNVGTTLNCIKAIELSKGEFFKLQAGDDMLFDESSISKMIRRFQAEQHNIIASKARTCTPTGELKDDSLPPSGYLARIMSVPPDVAFEYIATEPGSAYICAPAVFWRRSFYEQIGGFDPAYKYTEDWPTWLRICEAGFKISFIEEDTVIYRLGGVFNSTLEMNQMLNRAHYEECVSMFKNIAIPALKRNKKYGALFKCWFAQHTLRFRGIYETVWGEWGIWSKLMFRFENLPFFLSRRFYSGAYMGLKKPLATWLLLSAVIYFAPFSEASWLSSFLLPTLWLLCLGMLGFVCLFNTVCFGAGIILRKLGIK